MKDYPTCPECGAERLAGSLAKGAKMRCVECHFHGVPLPPSKPVQVPRAVWDEVKAALADIDTTTIKRVAAGREQSDFTAALYHAMCLDGIGQLARVALAKAEKVAT